MMRLGDIAAATSGKMLGEADILIKGIATDSRQDCSDRLFIALEGENFDGHDYVKQAQQAGAAAVMLHKASTVDTPSILVHDTLSGMAALTKSWRQRFDIPVVAITGSVGKTSLKEMIGCVLSAEKTGVVTQGNFNNEIGVPLTVTRLDETHEFAVIEMGMNHFGEIQRLSEMTCPTIAVINNAAASHLENLGSIAGVAQAKGEITCGLQDDGVLVINGDDEFADYWSNLANQRRVVKFGLQSSVDVTASYHFDDSGVHLCIRYFDQHFDLHVPVWGKHNVMNLLASVAVVKELGISTEMLQASLRHYTAPSNRSGRFALNSGVLIDDSYNANPASMLAAIDLLALEKQQHPETKTILILGDMAELGDAAEVMHQQVGQAAANQVDYCYAVGQYAAAYAAGFGDAIAIFSDQAALIEAVKQKLAERHAEQLTTCVLVKGSRFTRMDRVVKALLNEVKK